MDRSAEIATLIRKKIEGTLTAQEAILLQDWLSESQQHADFLKQATHEDLVWEDVNAWLVLREGEEQDAWTQRLEQITMQKIQEGRQQGQSKWPFYRRLLSYAAVLLLVASVSLLIYKNQHTDKQYGEIQNLDPGSNRAQITLSDGRVIELREDQDGVVLGEDLVYEDGTMITSLDNEEPVFASIVTPRGGQYQITLMDGTKVWLNAASKLTYPSRFDQGERRVELEGEGYFEVAKQMKQGKKVPFIIKTPTQEVEVLGTEFNISAYKDNGESAKTTLVEGSVQVHAQGETMLLKPGEQSVQSAKGLNKKKVDVSPFVAWKNNEFVFFETELKDALLVLSRWYDFDVDLKQPIPSTHLYGSISRKESLSEVLEILKSSGLKFRIENLKNKNRLIILP